MTQTLVPVVEFFFLFFHPSLLLSFPCAVFLLLPSFFKPAFSMEFWTNYQNYISEFRWEKGVTPLSSGYAPLAACVAYCAILPLLHLFMKNRKPLNVRYFAIIHNALLCVFSFSYIVLFSYEMLKLIQVLKPVFSNTILTNLGAWVLRRNL